MPSVWLGPGDREAPVWVYTFPPWGWDKKTRRYSHPARPRLKISREDARFIFGSELPHVGRKRVIEVMVLEGGPVWQEEL